jgi:UDP-N-acetyl-D-mannosaminuronate dehydrogenase
MDAKNQTAMMKLIDLLKLHKVVMGECPEIIEIIEELYVDIEKQQIIAANEDCSTNELGELLSGEQYYNETYGN